MFEGFSEGNREIRTRSLAMPLVANDGFYIASGFCSSRCFSHHGREMNEDVKTVSPYWL
jgi:hypothetical protein